MHCAATACLLSSRLSCTRTIQEEVKFRALEDAPAFVSAFMGDVQANLDDVFDLKFMVVDVMTRHPELLNDMFLTYAMPQ